MFGKCVEFVTALVEEAKGLESARIQCVLKCFEVYIKQHATVFGLNKAYMPLSAEVCNSIDGVAS